MLVALGRRFFAFGCSFTNYRWPTWADILGQQYQHYENWGQAGAGNHYIFNAVMECDQRRRWQPNDVVVVCWTNVMREDRYHQDRGWITLGNIMTSPIFTREFITDSVSERGNTIRDLAYVKAVKNLLELRGVTWRFLSMCSFQQLEPWDDRQVSGCQDVFELYQDVLDCVSPSFVDVLGTGFWHHNTEHRRRDPDGRVDYHPTPREHLQYVNTVLPEWAPGNIDPDAIDTGQRNGSNQNSRL